MEVGAPPEMRSGTCTARPLPDLRRALFWFRELVSFAALLRLPGESEPRVSMARTSARSQNLGVTFCSSEVRWDEDFFVVFLAAAAALEFGERGGLEFWSTLLRFLPANAWGERVGSDGESDAPVFPARVDRRSGDIVESSNTSPRGRGRARRAPGDPASFPAAAGSGFNMLRRARHGGDVLTSVGARGGLVVVGTLVRDGTGILGVALDVLARGAVGRGASVVGAGERRALDDLLPVLAPAVPVLAGRHGRSEGAVK